MMRIRLFDMIFGLAPLLIQQILEIVCRKRNDVGGVVLDNGLCVVFEDVGQLVGHHDLLCAVDSLLADVGHGLGCYL